MFKIIIDKVKLNKKLNTLELENETLKEELKENLIKDIFNNYYKIEKYDTILKENKRLRKINKKLRNMSKN